MTHQEVAAIASILSPTSENLSCFIARMRRTFADGEQFENGVAMTETAEADEEGLDQNTFPVRIKNGNQQVTQARPCQLRITDVRGS